MNVKTKKNDGEKSLAKDLLRFIEVSPTPYHAVAEMKKRFYSLGYEELKEIEPWRLHLGGKYMVSRNGSSLLAFRLGNNPPEESGFKIIGAHTDSPHLKLKPNAVYQKTGYTQLGVEVYGSVLLTTWTDRDLSLAGRIIPRDSNAEPVLIDLKRPILKVPQLAIHLNTKVNEKGLVLNKQTHMSPILELTDDKLDCEDVLIKMIAEESGLRLKDIFGLDLSLYDAQKGTIGGRNGEFLFSARLDNLASCHAAVEALLSVSELDDPTRVVVCFDHEEVGSGSAQGAESTFLKDVLERIQSHFKPSREGFLMAVARSFLISSDMAHAIHPNYADMHEPHHWPRLNGGPVIKINANQRYATDGESAALFERLCVRANISVQKFVNRSDLACGSTIGPITATNLGIRTVDVGNPMLSMHSIRETAAVSDHKKLISVFREFFSCGHIQSQSKPKSLKKKK